ncbi:hypothetical protein AB7C87_05255 [Natrarchaeobius sp. A-rgal3]|uniref:hypothetical protein n=1 Tax=Natrarchaeobius versutus TaxID=1679078 RepID=UPI003510C032
MDSLLCCLVAKNDDPADVPPASGEGFYERSVVGRLFRRCLDLEEFVRRRLGIEVGEALRESVARSTADVFYRRFKASVSGLTPRVKPTTPNLSTLIHTFTTP